MARPGGFAKGRGGRSRVGHYALGSLATPAFDAAARAFRKTNQLGDTITSVYDMAGRLTKKEYRTLANSPAGTIASQDTFTFDAASRMLTERSSCGKRWRPRIQRTCKHALISG